MTAHRRIDRSTTITADPATVWAVLADFGAISAWVPMIQHSCLLSDQVAGEGTVRRVQIARQTLVERVATWDPPRRLAYDIDGLPAMVGRVRTTWVLSAAASGTGVELTTEIETRRNPASWVIAGKVLERMATAAELMLAGLTAAVTDPVTDPADCKEDA